MPWSLAFLTILPNLDCNFCHHEQSPECVRDDRTASKSMMAQHCQRYSPCNSRYVYENLLNQSVTWLFSAVGSSTFSLCYAITRDLGDLRADPGGNDWSIECLGLFHLLCLLPASFCSRYTWSQILCWFLNSSESDHWTSQSPPSAKPESLLCYLPYFYIFKHCHLIVITGKPSINSWLLHYLWMKQLLQTISSSSGCKKWS